MRKRPGSAAILAVGALLAGCRGIGDIPAPTVMPERAGKPRAEEPEKTPAAVNGTVTPEPAVEAGRAASDEVRGRTSGPEAAKEVVPIVPGAAEAGASGPAELPRGISELVRQQKQDVSLDLDGDGRDEISTRRLEDGRTEITVSFAASGGRAARRYLVNAEGRILRFLRDDDGDGTYEELLVAGLRGGWFRAVRGERAYYILEGNEEKGRAKAWHDAGHLPSPGMLLRTMKSMGADVAADLAHADVETEWEGGRRWLFHDRRGKELGAGLFGRFFRAGGRLLPLNAAPEKAGETPAKKPVPTRPSGDAVWNKFQRDGRALPDCGIREMPCVFLLLSKKERRLIELAPFRHSVRGLPEELLTAPPGRALCRLVPGREECVENAVLYQDAAGDWKGWFDADGDGCREGSILRWSRETVIEYPQEKQVVTEVYVEGVLSERRFRPEGKDEPQSVEYYGESGLVRREVDTNGDGRFDRYEFPENGGLKVYEDTDADGLPDKWLKKGADDAPKGDSKSGGNAEGEPAASR